MTYNTWTISPLLLATATVDRSQGLLYRDIGEKVQSGVLAFLLENGVKKVLVDSGVCGLEETTQFRRYFHRTPEQTLEAQLARCGTSPTEIDIVINTHLHMDHCAGNELCTNARWITQKKEMDYWRRPLRAQRQAYKIELQDTRFELLDGDAEVQGGIRVMFTPGHSPGSQSVLVDTAEGLYVLPGDAIPHFANMDVRPDEPFWPNGIYVDLNEYYRSLDILKNMEAVILPGHDLRVAEKRQYP